MRLLAAAGRRIAVTIVNEPGLVHAIRAIMPDAIIAYRPVFSTHDANPRSAGWPTGQQWFDRLWPHMAGLPATYFIFSNEWLDNRQPPDVVRRFALFYSQLIDACLRAGVLCTVGDFSPGTPGYPDIAAEAYYLPILAPMFIKAARTGCPVGWHSYSPEGAGAIDMSVGAEHHVMRWERYAREFTGLLILGTEAGNAAKDVTGRVGMYRPETPLLQRQYADMLAASPERDHYLAACWWQICDGNVHKNPEADWSKDDWTPALWNYFASAAGGMPLSYGLRIAA